MVNEKDPSDCLKLDDSQFHKLRPRTKYRTSSVDIPRYTPGCHYKTYSADFTINFFTGKTGEFDCIMFVNSTHGKLIMRKHMPKDGYFHWIMRIENDGVWIDIIDCTSRLNVNPLCMVNNKLAGWMAIEGSMAANAVSAFAEYPCGT